MCTFFRRLQHYCNKTKQPLIPQDARFELGKKVNEAFRQSEYKSMLVFKIESVEPEGVFTALSYPRYFKPEIDKIIADYYKEHAPPPKRERKRIPVKQPAYKKQFNSPKHKRRY